MRTTTLALLMTVLAVAPAAAQDTTVMIQNKDCTVKVDGKRLPAAEEKKACEQMQSKMKVMELRAKEMNQQAQSLQERSKVMEAQGVRMRRDLELRSGELARIEEEMPARVRELTTRAMATIAARPRFGITIDTRPRDTDKWGAYISAVTPGGPAAKAGVRSGDVITKLAGKAVTGSGDETPGIKLIAMIGALEPNKAVDVQLRRGNDTKTVKVTPSDDETFFAGPVMVDSIRRTFGTMFEAPSVAGVRTRTGMDPEMMRIIERNGDPLTSGSYQFSVATTARGPLASLEMATLNAGLGSYFGTTDGVLIINAGEKQELGLLSGDVVTSVDGRKVTSPSQLMRILRTYEQGEEFKLQIMRQKRAETVSGKMP
jgi:C-terminal processing protease CtpA/Prc